MIFNKKNILSGYNFARISDHVFAENLIDENKNPVPTIFNLEISKLKINDIIFCKTDYINILFNKIKNLSEYYELNLITHESDYEINEKIFHYKPNCIAKWYAINVNYDNKNLIPIPLGIGNDHSKITLKIEDIKISNIENKKLLYVNHRKETNVNNRAWIYDFFENNDWCTVDQPNLSLSLFQEKIQKHKFMICPKGNGIDTHRLWECLYSGVVPIVEKHITYKNMENLPILFVDSFSEINEKKLQQEYEIIKFKSLEMLDIYNWEKIIKE